MIIILPSIVLGFNFSYPLGEFNKYWNKGYGIDIKYFYKYSETKNVEISLHSLYFKRKMPYLLISNKKYPIPNIILFAQKLGNNMKILNKFSISVGLDNYAFLFYDVPFVNIYESIEMEVGFDFSIRFFFKKFLFETKYCVILSEPERIKYSVATFGCSF